MRKNRTKSRRKARASSTAESGRKARAKGATASARKASKAKATVRRDGRETPLGEANRRLKSIRVANEVATWVWDVRNDRMVADENLVRLFGVSAEDAAGGPIEKYIQAIHPDDRAAVEAAIAGALRGPNDRYETSYRIVRKNGETSWVSARGTVEREFLDQRELSRAREIHRFAHHLRLLYRLRVHFDHLRVEDGARDARPGIRGHDRLARSRSD